MNSCFTMQFHLTSAGLLLSRYVFDKALLVRLVLYLSVMADNLSNCSLTHTTLFSSTCTLAWQSCHGSKRSRPGNGLVYYWHNSKGGVTLSINSCNLPRNGVLPLARQVAGMALHCAMIVATCLARSTAGDSRAGIN